MIAKDLRRAAAILRREARAIKESRQFGRSQWFAGPFATALYREVVARDRADHDEMLDLAAKLETCAKSGDSCTRPARRVKTGGRE